MKLTNAMEPAVLDELHRLREEHSGNGEVCWCPLCRADMTALSLSALPPRYFTRRLSPVEGDPAHLTAIREAVGQAVRQVERHPKHSPGGAVAAGEPVWVVNFPLEEGFAALEEILHESAGACGCWTCRCDAIAFALNRYPARYGVARNGRALLVEDDRKQMRDELAAFLDLALHLVSTIPRH